MNFTYLILGGVLIGLSLVNIFSSILNNSVKDWGIIIAGILIGTSFSIIGALT